MVGRYFDDMDVALVEGYGGLKLAKIEVFRQEVAERPLELGEDRIALVTDDDVDPDRLVCRLDETDELAAFIVDRLRLTL